MLHSNNLKGGAPNRKLRFFWMYFPDYSNRPKWADIDMAFLKANFVIKNDMFNSNENRRKYLGEKTNISEICCIFADEYNISRNGMTD